MHLGDVIKKYRNEHGKMSMQAFADKCGLSNPPYVPPFSACPVITVRFPFR